MADGMRFAGRVFDGAGAVEDTGTINLYDVGTTTPVRATTSLNVTGDWEIDHATRGLFDIEIVVGTTTRRITQDVEAQFKSMWLWNADANEYAFGVTRTEDAASVEVAYFEGDRATMADGDLAYISYRMSDDGGTQEEVARVTWYQNDVNPSADGRYLIQVAVAGSLTDVFDANVSAAGVLTLELATALTLIGDTANTNMTVGLTINQGGADDNIFDGKSTDVAHPFTGEVEADTFFRFRKADAATAGGLLITGLRSSAGTAGQALLLQGWLGEAADTTDTSSSIGVVQIDAYVTDGGTSVAALADTGNAFAVTNAATTRLIVKGNGVVHVTNTTLVGLDAEDDVQIVRAMQRAGASGGIIESPYDNPFYDYAKLHALGLAGEQDERGEFMFALQPRLHAHEGAIWQLAQRAYDRDERIAALEGEIATLKHHLEAGRN